MNAILCFTAQSLLVFVTFLLDMISVFSHFGFFVHSEQFSAPVYVLSLSGMNTDELLLTI